MKVLDVLTDESRWVKSDFGCPGSPRCLGGAMTEIGVALPGWTRMEEAIEALFPERCRDDPTSVFRIVDFNNHPDTTFEDVRRVVKFADV